MTETEAFAFWTKVEPTPSGCWEWRAGRLKRKSYGSFRSRGRHYVAHRLAFTLCTGEIPRGLFVCHHCNNKGCVNPAHLYLATNQQNVVDAIRDGLWHPNNAAKRACSRCGGVFKRNKMGRRVCLPCRATLNRGYRHAARAVAREERKE